MSDNDGPESLPERLFGDLRRLYELEDLRTRRDWRRSLPVVEAVSDRWERASALGFGEGTSIYHHSYVFGDVVVGRYTWIGPDTLLDGTGGLEIGSWCSIGAGAQIYSHSSVSSALTAGNAPFERRSTKIGDRCWIGACAVIDMGVVIGEQCVVRPHSYVDQDLPESSVVAGAPARIVGRVTVDEDGSVRITPD